MASKSKTLTFKVAIMCNIRPLKINKQSKLLNFTIKMNEEVAGALLCRHIVFVKYKSPD